MYGNLVTVVTVTLDRHLPVAFIIALALALTLQRHPLPGPEQPKLAGRMRCPVHPPCYTPHTYTERIWQRGVYESDPPPL